MGDIHISAEVDSQKRLKIEMVYGNDETRQKTFNKSVNKIVKIGRNRENEIILENYSFSRVHTSFFFNDEEESWYVQDGINNKTSTNGTWIYLDWSWNITDKTCFRIGTHFIHINLIKNK